MTELMVKRAAKKLKKEKGYPHHKALEIVVQGMGFRNYNHWINHNKGTA